MIDYLKVRAKTYDFSQMALQRTFRSLDRIFFPVVFDFGYTDIPFSFREKGLLMIFRNCKMIYGGLND